MSGPRLRHEQRVELILAHLEVGNVHGHTLAAAECGGRGGEHDVRLATHRREAVLPSRQVSQLP